MKFPSCFSLLTRPILVLLNELSKVTEFLKNELNRTQIEMGQLKLLSTIVLNC